MNRKILIFANGSTHDGPMPRRALEQSHGAQAVAADGGVRVARDYGVDLDIVIGDMDSVDADELARLEAQGVNVQRYPREKNETDLEMALLWAVEQQADWVRVFGAMGGRLDQTMANIYLLALPGLQDRDVRLVSRAQETWLIYPGEHCIDGSKGDTVSLIPMSGDAYGIQTENLYYPLRDETLKFGPARGVSNVMDAEQARVRLREGLLLVVHTIGRA